MTTPTLEDVKGWFKKPSEHTLAAYRWVQRAETPQQAAGRLAFCVLSGIHDLREYPQFAENGDRLPIPTRGEKWDEIEAAVTGKAVAA